MCQPSKTNFALRTGYSLLELVIVLAILSAITAIAWPRVRPLLGRSSHRSAAQRLKADLAAAREQAVHNGEVWQLRAVLGTGRYVIGPAQSEQDANRSEQDAILYHELPDDVVFSQKLLSQPGSDVRQRVEESDELSRPGKRANDTRLAQFFPDGRATETVIELVRPETREKIAIRLRGLTGGITIGRAEPIVEPSELLAEGLLPAEEPNP